jgi:hypothetical protein
MRPRFTLRLLFILFTLVAIAFGAATNFALQIKSQVRNHQQAVLFLKGVNCEIEVDGRWDSKRKPQTRFSSFVKHWIDPNHGQAAGYVSFGYGRPIPAEIASLVLSELSEVQGIDSLHLELETLTPESLRSIAIHQGLDSLSLTYANSSKEVERILGDRIASTIERWNASQPCRNFAACR